MGDTKPSGKGKGASVAQRARLEEISATLRQSADVDPAVCSALLVLGGHPGLSMGQAGGLIQKGKDAVAELELTLPSDEVQPTQADTLFGEEG